MYHQNDEDDDSDDDDENTKSDSNSDADNSSWVVTATRSWHKYHQLQVIG